MRKQFGKEVSALNEMHASSGSGRSPGSDFLFIPTNNYIVMFLVVLS